MSASTLSVVFLAYVLGPAPAPRPLPPSRAASPRCAAETFEELGVRAEICEALAADGITAPNALQSRAIPTLAGRADVLVGAQTGSGKTLAYLVPVMQTLKCDEERSGSRARPKRPRALVLLPTRELAYQVRDVAKSIAHRLKLSVGLVHGGTLEAPQRRALEAPTDVLVATPGRLLQHLDRGAVYLGDVRHVVVDEVDTMFAAGFGAELDRVLAITTRDLAADEAVAARRVAGGGDGDAAAAAPRVQHVAVGATHPAAAAELYERHLSEAKRLYVEGTHSLPKSLRQEFLPCAGPDAKVTTLLQLLGAADEGGKPSLGRVVLFCNSQDSARFVDHTLTEEGYGTANYHGAIPARTRADEFEKFVAGDAHVLVATDLAARGLDRLGVAHVVQFDFAKSAEEYLHRAGRTARAGASGTIHSLVTKGDQPLVHAIQKADRAGEDIVSAGDAWLAERAAPKLKVRSSGRKPSAAAFPTCTGLTGRKARDAEEGGGLFGDAEPRGAARGRGGGGSGRGGRGGGGRGGGRARGAGLKVRKSSGARAKSKAR